MYPVDKKFKIGFGYMAIYDQKGVTIDNRHHGVDILTPQGTNVVAPVSGVVYYAQYAESWGNFVAIKFEHNGAPYRVYLAHLDEINTPIYTKVDKGVLIATSGNTGKFTTGPHLHVEVRRIIGRGDEYHINPSFILT